MATRIIVKDFSCITEAEVELSNLTVLIGPSASGKSVISKLVFFFNDLLSFQLASIEDRKGVDHFKDLVKERFKEWFPVDAWGSEKFCIEFESGAFQVRLTRIEYRKKLGENMRVWLSPFFEEQYLSAVESLRNVEPKGDLVDWRAIEPIWRIRNAMFDSLQKALGSDFHRSQTFIPAGRSFFTSVGKSIAAFEHGRVLDPLILRFGRLYAALRERGGLGMGHSYAADSKWVAKLMSLMDGKLVAERSREYLQSEDGRKIPISALSSGQQELMPLALALRYCASLGDSRYQQLIFIEEPEAHLFPSAQSDLVEIFGAFLNMSKGRARLFITTHSPYVLAKLNNLIKARELAGARRGTKRHVAVNEIVSNGVWLDGRHVAAYAIVEGRVIRIQDPDDNLIDALYMDEVSGDISREFSRLLEVEFAQ